MSVKEKTKRAFLINARQIFMAKGISNAYMDDIAVASGKTRRTIYRHFRTKEDLAYEVLIEILIEWNTYQKQVYESLTGNGLESLKEFLYGIKEYMEERIEIMGFLAEFDYYFKDSHKAKVSEELMVMYKELSAESDIMIDALIDKGIQDGSIKALSDQHLIVATISSVLWGFGQRVAFRGKSLALELSVDPIKIINSQIEIYIDYLKGA